MDPITVVVAAGGTPSYWGYVAAGYAFAAITVGGYTLQVVRRGRKLSRRVPAEKRRWL